MEVFDLSTAALRIKELVKSRARKVILSFLCGREKAEFSEIIGRVKVSRRVDYHVRFLIREGVIEKIERGVYRVKPGLLSIVRHVLDIKMPLLLIGGLGEEVTLYKDLRDALEVHGYKPDKVLYVTSPEVREKFFKVYGEVGVNFIVQPYKEVLRENLDKLIEITGRAVEENIFNHEILVDLTGGTKPLTIALLRQAVNYNLKALYFSGRKIIWINEPY